MIPVAGKKPDFMTIPRPNEVEVEQKPHWRERVREIVYPVWFDGSSYIFDADGKMLFQVRGWGGLTSSGLSDTEAYNIQCQWAETVVKVLNAEAVDSLHEDGDREAVASEQDHKQN